MTIELLQAPPISCNTTKSWCYPLTKGLRNLPPFLAGPTSSIYHCHIRVLCPHIAGWLQPPHISHPSLLPVASHWMELKQFSSNDTLSMIHNYVIQIGLNKTRSFGWCEVTHLIIGLFSNSLTHLHQENGDTHIVD